MAFSLIPREIRFCDMLDEAAVIANRTAHKFLDMLTMHERVVEPAHENGIIAHHPNGKSPQSLRMAEAARDIKSEELKCDKVVEKIVKSLCVSFITPFDREDINTLAKSLDDVTDHLEETAHRFASFRIDKPTPEAVQLARFVVDCCGHLEKAVHLIRDLNRHEEISSHLVEVGRLENEADNVYRNADAALFAEGNGSTDILMLIKLREIYCWLEGTVDSCKHVANVISEIVIKGS